MGIGLQINLINDKLGVSFYEKKLFGLILVLTFAVVLAACGNGNKSGSDDKKITVGASPAPHAEILEKAKPLLEKKKVMN